MAEEKKLQSYLQAGETVRWEGETAQFPLLEKTYSRRIWVQWIASTVVCGGLLFWYLSSDVVKETGIIVLLGVVLATLLLSPVWERYCLVKQRYWMTNRRIIVMSWDQTLYSMPLEDVDAYRVIRDQSSTPCLVLGSHRFEDIAKQLRWRACHPKEDVQRASTVDGMILYAVKNVDEAVSFLKADAIGKTA